MDSFPELVGTIRRLLDDANIGYTLQVKTFVHVMVHDVATVRDLFNQQAWARTRTHTKTLGVWIARPVDDLVPVVLSEKNIAVPTTFRLATRGLIIAFVGPDGSGKSTLVSSVRAWLQPFSQTEFYLGHGDPVTRAWQSLAQTKNRILRRNVKPAPSTSSASHPTVEVVKRDPIRETIRDAADVARALRKRSDLRQMVDVRRRGEIAVTDRFPHHHVFLIDGPAIRHKPKGPPLRQLLNSAESLAFKEFERVQPDVLFRLKLGAQTAWARKRENTLEEIEAKVDAVNTAVFPSAIAVDVDAEMSADDVLGFVKDHLWEMISRHPQRIEFVGVPASGKSTLANAVREQLSVPSLSRPERQEKLAVHHRAKSGLVKLTSFGEFSRAQAGVVRQSLGFSLSVRPLNRQSSKRLMMLMREAQNTDMWNNRRSEHAAIEIHEQQLLQEIFSLTFLRSTFSDGALDRLIEELRPYLADLIIWVDTPPDVVISRMDARLSEHGATGEIDKRRLEGELTEADLTSWLPALERVIDAARSHGLDVVTIDGTKPIGLQVAEVLDTISSPLQHDQGKG